MPRTADAYRQLKDRRRETILEAARRVFARNGLAATRIGDIAAEAGVSQGLLYHYFPNKETLFTTIVESALAGAAALAASALEPPGSAWDRLRRLCDEMLAGVVASPDYVLVILQTFTSESVPEGARQAVAEYGRRTFADLVALIAEAQAEGKVVAGDPGELALAFTACIQGVSLSRLQSAAMHESPMPTSTTILRLLEA